MFQHNKKQADLLMRSAIPLMEKLDIPPTPYNYGIWYEYVSNRTPELNKVVDTALRRFGNLPTFVSQELFSEFILTEEFQHAHRQGPALRKITDDLESESGQVTEELSQFSKILNQGRHALKNTQDNHQVERIASLLELNSFKMNRVVEHFNDSLASAQEELSTLKAELAEARQNTELDPMTLLANEKGFERILYSLVPYAEDDLTLLVVDIDNLGDINQEYSKKAGTSLIRYVAKLLQTLTPEGGVLARLKGGQYAMLLSETELSVAAELAEHIRQQVSIQKIRYKQSKVPLRQVTVSIGLATLFGNEGPSDLIDKAQHYLTFAKRSGKNCVSHHE